LSEPLGDFKVEYRSPVRVWGKQPSEWA
jgi:hypothetical protein